MWSCLLSIYPEWHPRCCRTQVEQGSKIKSVVLWKPGHLKVRPLLVVTTICEFASWVYRSIEKGIFYSYGHGLLISFKNCHQNNLVIFTIVKSSAFIHWHLLNSSHSSLKARFRFLKDSGNHYAIRQRASSEVRIRSHRIQSEKYIPVPKFKALKGFHSYVFHSFLAA